MKYYGTDDGTNYGFSSKQNRFKSSIGISDAEHAELLQGQANGKQIKTDSDGHPYLADYDTTPTVEQQIVTLQKEIEELEKKQYRSMKAVATKTATKDDEEYFNNIESQIKEARTNINKLKSV